MSEMGPRERQLREMREAKAARAAALADARAREQAAKPSRKTDKRQNPTARQAHRGSAKMRRAKK